MTEVLIMIRSPTLVTSSAAAQSLPHQNLQHCVVLKQLNATTGKFALLLALQPDAVLPAYHYSVDATAATRVSTVAKTYSTTTGIRSLLVAALSALHRCVVWHKHSHAHTTATHLLPLQCKALSC
jgi:hypothetical protein